MENQSEILLYQTDDGQTRIQVHLIEETIWLSLTQMAELFQRDKSVISRAQRKKPMTMRDWIDKLHGFLQLNERDILQGAGRVSKQLADEKAAQEYHKFAEKRRLEKLTNSDFDRLLESSNPSAKLKSLSKKKDEDSV